MYGKWRAINFGAIIFGIFYFASLCAEKEERRLACISKIVMANMVS